MGPSIGPKGLAMKRLALLVLAGASLVACQKPQAASAPEAPKPPVTDPHLTEAPPRPQGIDRGCEKAADCRAVGCECGCSGGGVGLREDVVSLASVDRWYQERGCTAPTTCDKAPCPPAKVDCVGGACHVVYGEAGASP
jgi:hypothetical protein